DSSSLSPIWRGGFGSRDSIEFVGCNHPLKIARTPSTTYWTAKAASSTPRRRERTILPVMPSSRLIRPAKANAITQHAATSITIATRATIKSKLPRAWPASKIVAVIRAGTRHERNRQRKSCDVTHVFFDRLLGRFAFPPDAHPEYHFGTAG